MTDPQKQTDGHIEDSSNYETTESDAVKLGKKALKAKPWLFNRCHFAARGFFFELRQNDKVHPEYYSVHCVDGAGSKLFLTAWSGNYSLQPTDALAMNANDMATAIHAYPDTLNLYFAIQKGAALHMGEIMGGFANALEKIKIKNAPFDVNIGKIETASLDEVVSLGVPNLGWDVGVALTGYIKKNEMPLLEPKPRHIIVGVSSTGLHSNGYTSARHALLTEDYEYREEWKKQYHGKFRLEDKPLLLQGKTLLEALQAPTALYLSEALEIGRKFDSREIYGVNITGNGLGNFNRVGDCISFEITDPLEPLGIHKLLVEESKLMPEETYTKYNMGMGFAYIVPSQDIAEKIVNLINSIGENKAKIIGEVWKSNNPKLTTIMHKPYEGPKLTFEGYYG